jgi:membrane-associated protease RseP (regulator of RpoE activity)
MAAGGEVVWTAAFSGAEGGSESAAFAVGDGRHLVAVAVSGVEAGKGRLKLEGRELPVEVFVDPVSRVVIFRMSGPPGKAIPLLAAAPTGRGVAVRCGNGGTGGRIIGVVKQIEGKILPLCLLKVEYDGQAPIPGTPLTNASGSVVAVSHQSTSPREGFALPVEVVKRVLEGVQGEGRVTRGWIGLKLQPAAVVPQVTGVQAESPAAKAGVKPGDVLLQVGSRRVEDYADAVNAFYFLRPGVATPFRIKRGNQQFALSLMPVERAGE